jgi:ankyrin repeat protein
LEGRYGENEREIISRGADVNVKNNGGLTALIFASQNDNVVSMELLIPMGSNIHEMTSSYPNMTSLSYAAENGNIDAVSMLYCKGADVHSPPFMKPHMHASENGHVEVITFTTGMTPLMHASENGHVEVIAFLMDVGEDSSK